jgi:hypothetical protein
MSYTNTTSFADKHTRKINRMSAQDLAQLLAIAEELRRAIELGDDQKVKALESSKHLLAILMEYLIQNIDNPSVDPSLIALLQKFLGIDRKKDKKKATGEEEKEEELDFEGMSKEQKAHIYRMMVYEIYKVLNPHRIAGETPIENFIHNVQRYGIKEALNHEGSEFVKNFREEDLEKIESHKFSFVDNLAKEGIKHSTGWGRGV